MLDIAGFQYHKPSADTSSVSNVLKLVSTNHRKNVHFLRLGVKQLHHHRKYPSKCQPNKKEIEKNKVV